MMRSLRENPLKEIDGSKVIRIEDYQSGKSLNMKDGSISEMDLPRSNVLIYYTEDGSKIAARPSGTEPKIKFYMSVNERTEDDHYDAAKLQKKIDRIKTELNL